MDDIDRRLIAALRQNPRRKIVDLARAIGLSRTATQARLDRLTSDGTIIGFDVLLRRPGLTTSAVYIFIEYGRNVTCGQVVPTIATIPEVELCCSLSGKPDLLVRCVAPTTARVSEIVEEIGRICGVERVTTQFELDVLVDRRGSDHRSASDHSVQLQR